MTRIARIDPTTNAVYDDDYENARPGEFYVDGNNNIQCKGLEEEPRWT